ncbi:hypothetical protein [Paraburkholderia youngii]|uniref:hypothetical protein n=1 Tax=Paraburkholderia youngii TaxID=2782701 RepID=UPI003D1D104E
MTTLKARGSAPASPPADETGTVQVCAQRLDTRALALLNLRFGRKVILPRVPPVSANALPSERRDGNGEQPI